MLVDIKVVETMIGTKFYKGNFNREEYAKCAKWCNENNATIVDRGDYYEVVEISKPSLEELKQNKISSLKEVRDTKEVEPIEYNGSLFDYDSKARERINAAIIALEVQGDNASIEWTTADDKDVTVTATDLKSVVALVAVRSNTLHVAYRKAKEAVENAQTEEELNAIILDV